MADIKGKEGKSSHSGFGPEVDLAKQKVVECPACGQRSVYLLADGRQKCRSCRKKFTPNPRRRRIPQYLQKEIARLFWLMIPAETGSRILGIDRKTLQEYYSRLRRRIAADREALLRRIWPEVSRELTRDTGGAPAAGFFDRDLLVFLVFLYRGELYLILPEALPAACGREDLFPAPGLAVYAANRRILDKRELKNFHLRPISPAAPSERGKHGAKLYEFWVFARNRLGRYRGGIRRNFPLFLREMEFRFNCREEEEGLNQIAGFLRPVRGKSAVQAKIIDSSEEWS